MRYDAQMGIKMKKKYLLCIVILCLLFSGCGKQEAETNAQKMQIEYEAYACGVQGLQGTINTTLMVDSKLYAGVYTKGTAVEDGRYRVVIYDIFDGTSEQIILQKKEEMAMWSFTVLENGDYKALFLIWDAENKNYSSLCLATFDKRGNVIEEQDITQKVTEQVQDPVLLNSFCMDRIGNLYFYTSTYEGLSAAAKIYYVGNSGEVQLIKEHAGNILGIQVVSSHIWAVEDSGSQKISIYDLSGQNKGDEKAADLKLSAGSQVVGISDGLTDTQKFIDLDANVYAYDIDSGQLEKLFAYEDVGLEFGVFNTGKLIAVGPDEFYVIKKTTETEDGGRTYDWIKITKSGEVSQKEILTIAVSEETSLLKEAVAAFNKSSGQYKAVIKVYETDGADNSSTLLQADISAGNLPDMIATDMIDLDQMIDKGLLHDLSDLLEGDTDLSKKDYIGRSLEIYARNDKLYAIPQCLCITALSGKQKILDGREKWDLKEFEEYVHGFPNQQAVTLGISKNLMLQMMMEQYMFRFVDWENKSCTFESREFVELLQFINMYPEEGVDVENDMEKLVDLLRSDEMILYPSVISNVFDYQIMKALWGEEIIYIGFPSEEGSGIQLLDTATAYVITENSTHKEEMWQIIKYMTTDPSLAKTGFPSYRPLFIEACENAMEKNMVEAEDGTLVEKPAMEIELAGMKIDVFASTKEEIAMMKGLFEKAEPVKAASSEIKNIIQEEVSGYFSGQKEVYDVVGVIQNRVSIYLNE